MIDFTFLKAHRTVSSFGCLIPGFESATRALEWKDALWDRYATAALRPRTQSEQQYSDRKLRPRNGAESLGSIPRRWQSGGSGKRLRTGRPGRRRLAQPISARKKRRSSSRFVATRCPHLMTASVPYSRHSRISRALLCSGVFNGMASRDRQT